MSARVAIACSGLGHVRRGNETWAATVADALHRAGTTVTLLGGGPHATSAAPFVRLKNLPRETPITRGWLSWHHRYLLEQRTFARSLTRWLREHPHEIIHLADPALAWILQRHAASLRVRVIYKDGLLLGPDWCRKFAHVQILAPFYLESAQAAGCDTRGWHVIPHLVDPARFQPATDFVRAAAREKFFGNRISRDTFVILAVGDFSPQSNKRLDWIIREIAQLPDPHSVHLVLAGQASATDLSAFETRARAALGERVTLLPNLAATEMPNVYGCADAFAHAALREPFGIVFLEALASGLPVVAHHFPVTRWIIGDGGLTVDAESPGTIAAALDHWRRDPAARRAIGERARARAVSAFAPEKIVPLYQNLYAAVSRA